ncbi:hypothetical protein ACNOYE_06895 [Nannocystaceae bacterium ST9]
MAIKQYAESRGWLPIPLEAARFWLFRHPEQTLQQIQIPMDEDDVGFVDAMRDIVQTLSELERRPEDEIVGDLQWPDADILRVRVVSRDSEAGQLSLTGDVELREGIRRALLASACSVITPARFHPRLSRNEADSLLAACRAGQTERGSYVVKVICPLDAVRDVADQTLPFTRKVTTHLMTSTARLIDDIEHDRLDEYEAPDKQTLSWNLCDALLRMRPERDAGHIDILAHWAADRRFPPEAPARVSIKAEYFSAIETIAGVLRPSASVPKEEQLVGTVEQLAGVVGEDGRRAGEVQFTVFKDGESVRTKAMLDVDQYEVAMRAHQEGNALVVLHGILYRGSRISWVKPVSRLQPLGDQSSGD